MDTYSYAGGNAALRYGSVLIPFSRFSHFYALCAYFSHPYLSYLGVRLHVCLVLFWDGGVRYKLGYQRQR